MAIAFARLEVISTFRVRLTFTNNLAAGAFAAVFYGFTSLDSMGIDPTVLEAIVVPNHPAAVELALDYPLVQGARYQLDLTAGVPATDASTAASAVQPFFVPVPRAAAASRVYEVDASIFQRDLVHDGEDYVEDPNGDLSAISGPENARQAVRRRVVSNGLPWNRAYGGHPRRHVDAPSGSRDQLRHDLATAALQDDRVRSARVDAIEDSESGDFEPNMTITLINEPATRT